MVQKALENMVAYAQSYIDLVQQSPLTPSHKAYALLSVYKDMIITSEGLGHKTLATKLLGEAQPFVESLNGGAKELSDFYGRRYESTGSEVDTNANDSSNGSEVKSVSQLVRQFVSERPGLKLATMQQYVYQRTSDLTSRNLIFKNGDSPQARLNYYASNEAELIKVFTELMPSKYVGQHNETGLVDGVAEGPSEPSKGYGGESTNDENVDNSQESNIRLPPSIERRISGIGTR